MENFACEDMRTLVGTSRLTEIEDIVLQLRRWCGIVPEDIFPRGLGMDAYKFLRWLIRGRVAETVRFLEGSDSKFDHRVALRIRTLGNKTLPSASAQAKVMASAFWGYIGTELGNPTWVNNQGVVIVELPNSNPIRFYLEMIGGHYGQNEFFQHGYVRKNGATADQMDAVRALVEERNLRSYSLWGGGVWVYSFPRVAETAARERAVQKVNGTLDELRHKANQLMRQAMEARGVDFSPRVLSPEVRERLIAYMREKLPQQTAIRRSERNLG